MEVTGSSSSHGPGWRVRLECGLEGWRSSWLMVSSHRVSLEHLFQTLQQFHLCPKVSPQPAGIRHHGNVFFKPMKATPLLQCIHIASCVMEAHRINSKAYFDGYTLPQIYWGIKLLLFVFQHNDSDHKLVESLNSHQGYEPTVHLGLQSKCEARWFILMLHAFFFSSAK